MAQRVRRRQDDHRAARPSDSPLRHRREWQRQLALQKPRRRSHSPRSPRLRNPGQLRRGERYRQNPPLKGVKIGRRYGVKFERRLTHILRNVLMALLEQPHATLHDVLRILSDNEFRKRIAKSLRNDTVRTFLLKEFERFSLGYRADGTAPIQNKVGAFLADPLLSRILTAPETDLHIRRIMDQGQVLLVNLAKGHIGEDSS